MCFLFIKVDFERLMLGKPYPSLEFLQIFRRNNIVFILMASVIAILPELKNSGNPRY